jgi:hypothetical protein
MMSNLLLLDVAPDPVTPVTGIGALILIAVIVLMLTAATIVGFIFLLKRIRRSRQPAFSSRAEDGLSESQVGQFQPSHPNQP